MFETLEDDAGQPGICSEALSLLHQERMCEFRVPAEQVVPLANGAENAFINQYQEKITRRVKLRL